MEVVLRLSPPTTGSISLWRPIVSTLLGPSFIKSYLHWAATGSSRIPGSANGIFALRTSQGLAPRDGLVKAWAYFDTPAVFSKDLSIFPSVLSALLDHNLLLGTQAASSSTCSRSFRVVYPLDFLPEEGTQQRELLDNFANDLANHGGSKLRRVRICDDWAVSASGDDKDLNHYFHNVPKPLQMFVIRAETDRRLRPTDGIIRHIILSMTSEHNISCSMAMHLL